jgi:flagellar motility protein MotE (MotC chaperone)
MIVMSKFLLILLMLTSANTFAAISKWVDVQGRVHYSDQPPPPEAKAETLRSASDSEGSAGTSGVTATSAPAAPKTIAEREAELKKAQQAKQAAADQAAQKQAAADAVKANCANAQQNLRTLQSGVRMVEVDAKGERSYIDDTQRQQRIEKSQQDISNLCK